MRALVSVADHDLPPPSKYSGTTSTVVDSGRNVKGYVVAAVIRDDLAKIEMSYNFISVEDWAYILQLFSIKHGGSFTNQVCFFCQDTGVWETRTMYISDRRADIYLRNKDGSIRGYAGAQLSLIEV